MLDGWALGATVARLHGMQEVAGSNLLCNENPAESISVFSFGIMLLIDNNCNDKPLCHAACY